MTQQCKSRNKTEFCELVSSGVCAGQICRSVVIFSDEAWLCLNGHLAVRIADISLYNVPCQCRQCPVPDVCVRCVMTVSRVGEPVFSKNINSHPYVRHILTQFLNIYGNPSHGKLGKASIATLHAGTRKCEFRIMRGAIAKTALYF
jgi:hypothetical protein